MCSSVCRLFPQSLICLEECGAAREQLRNLPPTERDTGARRFMRRPGSWCVSLDTVQLLFWQGEGLGMTSPLLSDSPFSNSNFPDEQVEEESALKMACESLGLDEEQRPCCLARDVLMGHSCERVHAGCPMSSEWWAVSHVCWWTDKSSEQVGSTRTHMDPRPKWLWQFASADQLSDTLIYKRPFGSLWRDMRHMVGAMQGQQGWTALLWMCS